MTLYCVKNVKEDLIWVGGSDRRLALFENVFPIPRGVSYNAYLVQDKQTVLMDTVDSSIGSLFFENLEHALNGKMLNYRESSTTWNPTTRRRCPSWCCAIRR